MTPHELKLAIEEEMRRVSALSSIAEGLNGDDKNRKPAHSSYYALNRAWNNLGDASRSLAPRAGKEKA